MFPLNLPANIRRYVGYLGQPATDFSSPESRAAARARSIILTGITAAATRAVTAIVGMITVPLTLTYLGPERYGLWMTLASIISFFAFADLGIGSSLLNAIARASGENDIVSMRKSIANAYAPLVVLAITLFISFSGIALLINWSEMLSLHSDLERTEVPLTLLVLFAAFSLNIPCALIQRIQMALQLGVHANFWQIASSISTLFVIFFVITYKLGLPWLVAASAGTPIIFSILNTATFFLRSHPQLRPTFSDVSRTKIKRLAKTGALFFVSQVGWPLIVSSDNVFVAHYLGTDAVTQYAVPERLFSLVPMLVGLALQPLWAAYGEALGRGDIEWVQITYRRASAFAFFVSSTIALLSAYFGPFILNIWVGEKVTATPALLYGFALWRIAEVIGASAAFLLNAAGYLRFQAIVTVLTASACVTLKLILLPTLGLPGAVWSTFLGFATFTLIPYAVVLRQGSSFYKKLLNTISKDS